tara:strand:+ start:1664 stop:1963 length:300 start_codon:yes stop_codon:yes gene_type:complete
MTKITTKYVKSRVFKFYSDAGHGWLAVNLKDLDVLGIDKTQFTEYSYQRGQTVYLEEDCDAYKFVKLWEHLTGDKPKYLEKYTERSPIRSYDRIFENDQ